MSEWSKAILIMILMIGALLAIVGTIIFVQQEPRSVLKVQAEGVEVVARRTFWGSVVVELKHIDGGVLIARDVGRDVNIDLIEAIYAAGDSIVVLPGNTEWTWPSSVWREELE